jgi:hypothetical protein
MVELIKILKDKIANESDPAIKLGIRIALLEAEIIAMSQAKTIAELEALGK